MACVLLACYACRLAFRPVRLVAEVWRWRLGLVIGPARPGSGAGASVWPSARPGPGLALAPLVWPSARPGPGLALAPLVWSSARPGPGLAVAPRSGHRPGPARRRVWRWRLGLVIGPGLALALAPRSGHRPGPARVWRWRLGLAIGPARPGSGAGASVWPSARPGSGGGASVWPSARPGPARPGSGGGASVWPSARPGPGLALALALERRPARGSEPLGARLRVLPGGLRMRGALAR